jgi:hypothetical protein
MSDHHRLARRGDARIRAGGEPAQQRGRLGVAPISSSATSDTGLARGVPKTAVGGVTVLAALALLTAGRRGVTGLDREITFTGQILPVGGVRAVRRAGPGCQRSWCLPRTGRRARRGDAARIDIHPVTSAPEALS